MKRRPGYETLANLCAGKVVSLNGKLYVRADGILKPGDTYIGARNDVDVYTCHEVNVEKNWVAPEEGIAYVFDIHECVKVQEVKNDKPDYTVPRELLRTSR